MTKLPDSFLRLPIAHRGLHDVADGRPENSRAACRAGIAAGYGLELDLQLSRDGRAMVFHDYDLKRLTGQTGSVRAQDADALGRVGLIGNNEGIPTLAEILDLVAGRVPLLIELKDQNGQMGDTDGALERAVANDVVGYDGPAALMSFNPNMVRRLAGLGTGRPLGLVTYAYDDTDADGLDPNQRDHLRAIADYDDIECSFISHHANDLSYARVAELKAQGAAILTWTIRSAKAETEARKIADNVTFEGYMADIPA